MNKKDLYILKFGVQPNTEDWLNTPQHLKVFYSIAESDNEALILCTNLIKGEYKNPRIEHIDTTKVPFESIKTVYESQA
jgi:hypothetical protein